MIHLRLNGREVSIREGATILDVCRQEGLDIPTLCHDSRLEPYASCWVCLVEVAGAKGFVPSCATRVREGMVVTTDSDKVRAARRLALELLLSNHYGDCKPPCTLACPSNIDVQGYVALIANRRYREALELIKRDNPFPAVIGRVCPRPCEDACRRELVDEAVGIDWLKRCVADLDLAGESPYVPVCPPPVGKHVAVVGAGPAGLSVAYYLRQRGVDVTIYEAQPSAGGMLRYGIPDFRLPQDVLDAEIDLVLDMGVTLRTGVRVGQDVALPALRAEYDAVVLAVGAWKSRDLRVAGEDARGVVSGIAFLEEVASGATPPVGPRVAVIGGGNTAIDAARTSLRLGAREVWIYYRRTRAEMPAWYHEIDEAIEEGIHIEYLSAPVEVLKGNDRVRGMRLIRMELGAPDADGRRRPVPVEGSEYEVEADTVVAAVGQYADDEAMSSLPELVDERGYIRADTRTGETPVDGVFAAGDLVTGPDIAIRAIAGGKDAALGVARRLGLDDADGVGAVEEFLSRKEDLREVGPEEYAEVERVPRQPMAVRPVREAVGGFGEIEHGYTPEQAVDEAVRCLECGCHDLHECDLRRYAQEYGAVATRFLGEVQAHPIDSSHPFITRDPAKCILCGRCVRICLEVQGIGVLGYMYRGFSSVVAPSFGVPLGEDQSCISCGQCVSACPVGALTEKLVGGKTAVLEETGTLGHCSLCSNSCEVEFRYHGSLLTRVVARPVDGRAGNLCVRGRFQHGFLNEPRLEQAGDSAGARLRELMDGAQAPVIRMAGNLAAETIDVYLAQAEELGIPVACHGLEGIDPSWIETRPGRFFSSSSDREVVVVLGDLESMANVAFTDLCRLYRQEGFDLLVYGWESLATRRIGATHLDTLEQVSSTLDAGKWAKIDVVATPQTVGEAAGWLSGLVRSRGNVEVTRFWDTRNAEYLLRALAGQTAAVPEKPDLVIDIGLDFRDASSSSDTARVHIGCTSRPADLCLPLAVEHYVGGTSHRSGRDPVSAGQVDVGSVVSLTPSA